MKGIEPSVWGPHVWGAIHLICLGAPEMMGEAEAAHYRAFFQHLGGVLPCAKCREHYAEHMRTHGAGLDTALFQGGDALFRWSVDLHNAVSASVGKAAMPYEAARARWSPSSGLAPAPASASADAQCPRRRLLHKILWVLTAVVAAGAAAKWMAARRRRP